MIRDNGADRELGAYWEDRLVVRLAEYGLRASRIPQKRGAPDVEVEVAGGIEAHEVKHKTPTGPKFLVPGEPYPRRYVGMESYRLDLVAEYERSRGCRVFYTVHDWGYENDWLSEIDDLDAWRTAPFADLLVEGVEAEIASTYYRGKMTDQPVRGVYFPWNAFRPLSEYLVARGALLDTVPGEG